MPLSCYAFESVATQGHELAEAARPWTRVATIKPYIILSAFHTCHRRPPRSSLHPAPPRKRAAAAAAAAADCTARKGEGPERVGAARRHLLLLLV
eukprot:scaffold13743_cov62-Phaeocystis_antarctica.AAC.1